MRSLCVFAIVMGGLMASGCTNKFQKSPLPSPDNALIFKLEKKSQDGRDHPEYWLPSIESPAGEVLFSDAGGFPGAWTLYWSWDADGRVWIYCQDEDHVVRIHKRKKPSPMGDYSLGIWSGERPCDPTSGGICPPAEIFPAAVRAGWIKSKN